MIDLVATLFEIAMMAGQKIRKRVIK